MLLVPLVTGALGAKPAGGRIISVLLLAVVALGLFCVRTPLEAWLEISPLRPQNPRERRIILHTICIYTAVSLGALALLLSQIRPWGLFLVGAAAAAAFLGQTVLKSMGRRTRMAAQLVGSIGLTSTAVAAYYVACGRLDARALALWAANWVFAAHQIHYVQTRIRAARATTVNERLALGKWLILGEAVMVLALALAWRRSWLPPLAVLAFAPVLGRGFVWFFGRASRLQIHRLGVRELTHAVIFGTLLIVSFHVHG
jgi:hypothetical protein